jgi:hypothetical protein
VPPQNSQVITKRDTRPPVHFQNGRGDRIRTYDLLVPNQALYQAKLHPALGQVPLESASRVCSRPE